jgi:transposase
MENILNKLPKRKNISDLTKEVCDEIIRLHGENISKREICRRTGFYYNTIERVLHGYKPYLKTRPGRLSFEKQKALLLLSQQNKTDLEIAEALDTSLMSVRRYRKKYGIPSPESIKKRRLKKYQTTAARYAYLQKCLRFDVPVEWLLQYKDIHKLAYLNHLITDRKDTFIRKKRFDETTEWYKSYIEKFYDDPRFSFLYANWKEKDDQLLRPVLAHVIPPSKGGTNELNNLIMITYFENTLRKTLDQEKWDYVKAHINEYFL